MSDNLPRYSAASNIPIPDPSEITSREISKAKLELKQQFDDALAAASTLFFEKIAGSREIVETRLDGMDKTHVLLQDRVVLNSNLIKSEAQRISDLFDEKLAGILTRFDGIQVQFRERDIRTDQDKIAASTAVNAALQAQKEAAGAQNEANAAAITKSENSFTKEIDGLKTLINATKDAITSDVSNLTGRLDRGEGGSAGGREMSDEHRQNLGTILSIVATAVAVLTLVFVVMYHQPQQSVVPGQVGTQTTQIPSR